MTAVLDAPTVRAQRRVGVRGMGTRRREALVPDGTSFLSAVGTVLDRPVSGEGLSLRVNGREVAPTDTVDADAEVFASEEVVAG